MTDHNKDYQSSGKNDNSEGDDEELDRIGEPRRAEQQRLLTEIAQSTQDTSDELRLMNDNIENVTHEVRGTKEAIKSLSDTLRKYLDKKSE